jgi:hypothetical protein
LPLPPSRQALDALHLAQTRSPDQALENGCRHFKQRRIVLWTGCSFSGFLW